MAFWSFYFFVIVYISFDAVINWIENNIVMLRVFPENSTISIKTSELILNLLTFVQPYFDVISVIFYALKAHDRF